MKTSAKPGLVVLAIGGLIMYSAKARASSADAPEKNTAKDMLAIGVLLSAVGLFVIASHYLIDKPLAKKYDALR